MALKLLLVAFTTNRLVEVAGKEELRRVRFAAKSVVDLTADELETLEALTKSSGKLHFRDPIQEGGAKPSESTPQVVDVPDYAGQDVSIDKKSVDQLKAYLTFHDVAFDAKDSKSELLKLAQAHAAGDDDPDAGL